MHPQTSAAPSAIDPSRPQVATIERDAIIIRFAGDSGDGMQLTGTRFSESVALDGNDIATFPDFPAEIRAPAGSLAGVSGFQVQLASEDIYTAGDQPDVFVCMNPAALRRNLRDLLPGAVILVDEDAFNDKNLARAGFQANPVDDGTLAAYIVHRVPFTRLTLGATESITSLSSRDRERCKNFCALGLCFWMFGRSAEATQRWLDTRFGADDPVAHANRLALDKGYDYGVTTEIFAHTYRVRAAKLPPGEYRSITGNVAAAYGFTAAAQLANRPLVLAGYPITPASDILHTLASLKNFGVTTIQAEDEIAAASMALGAAYGGAIALTTSSGPGISLKQEAISLAVSVELPIVIGNVQRAGPSTGMPTKVEQADLLMVLWGRHGEAPVAVIAPSSPADCFDAAIEAVRVATKYMTPVFFLADGYLANASEPWLVPDVSTLRSIEVKNVPEGTAYHPFDRDPVTLARGWAVPGTPGLEHRIGGIEKEHGSGHISYDPENHEKMSRLRAEKIARIAHDIAPLEVDDPDNAEVLVLGWGSTSGALQAAVREARRNGTRVARAHLRWINPFPANLGEVLSRYDRVLVPEINLGQLYKVLRATYDAKLISFTRIQGRPFRVAELVDAINQAVEGA